MSVTVLRPRAKGRRKIGRALLPPRTSEDLQRYAASRGVSPAEGALLILTQHFVAQRRKRDPGGDRAAVLRQLEAIDERDSAA